MTAVSAAIWGDSSLSVEIVRSVLEGSGVRAPAKPSGDESVVVLVEPTPECWESARSHGAPIVLVTRGHDNDDDVVHGVRQGADAVLRPTATAEIGAAVQALATGDAALTARQARLVADAFRRASAVATQVSLTRREHDILASVELGHSVKQTARHLGISPKTVENLQSRLFRKLGVRNRAQAVAVAHRRGLVREFEPAEAG